MTEARALVTLSFVDAPASRPDRRRLRGAIWATVGYLLSPLSWWNDPFINLPLAYLFASLVSLLSRRLFAPAMVLGYWLTNIAGLALMSRGTAQLASGNRGSRRRDILLSVVAATGYTVLVVVLARLGVLQPLVRR